MRGRRGVARGARFAPRRRAIRQARLHGRPGASRDVIHDCAAVARFRHRHARRRVEFNRRVRRLRDRALQIAREDRRRRNGDGVPGRAAGAGQTHRGAEARQARHGQRKSRCALCGRAAGARDHGPSPYRASLRRRHRRRWKPLFCHGACRRHSDRQILRRAAAHRARAPGVVRSFGSATRFNTRI